MTRIIYRTRFQPFALPSDRQTHRRPAAGARPRPRAGARDQRRLRLPRLDRNQFGLLVPAKIQDREGYTREAEAARRLGYLGKSCIHPTQIELANAAFRPTDAEIAHSLKVVRAAVDAKAKGIGAFTVDGRMVDGPFIRRAQQILALARRLKLIADDERGIE